MNVTTFLARRTARALVDVASLDGFCVDESLQMRASAAAWPVVQRGAGAVAFVLADLAMSTGTFLRDAAGDREIDDKGFTFAAVDATTGEQATSGPLITALRCMTAAANGDDDMLHALILAAVDHDGRAEHARLIIAAVETLHTVAHHGGPGGDD